MRVIGWGLGCAVLSAGLCLPLSAQTTNQKPSSNYTVDVAPIMKANCLSCHTGKDSSANLDLSKPEVVKAKVNVILQRMRGEGGKPLMPLGFKAVPKEKIAKIEEWANFGAPIGGPKKLHWAYVQPVRPTSKLKSNWIANPIDAFVLEQLNVAKLTPSKPAPKETLLRRVYLDLIGIPPTVKQLDAFLGDTRPDAYERVVDQLLKSPHYGERQARFWLDYARYADSNGYEKDLTRQAFPFRDWVINAYNQNMPFDQFTIEQLAGDMLPNPTLQERIATGFHRNSMFNEEGGVDPAESQFNTIIDRVSTTGTVWLGTTIGCARCHDHKYDPFSQRDFYKSYAIFGNTDYRVEGDYKKTFSELWREPNIKVVTPEVESQRAKLEANVRSAEADLKAAINANSTQFDRWKKELATPSLAEFPLQRSVTAANGTTLNGLPNGFVVASGTNPNQEKYVLDFGEVPAGTTAIQLEVAPINGKGVGRSGSDNFVLTGIEAEVSGLKQNFDTARADFVQEGHSAESTVNGKGSPGWAVYPQGKKAHTLVAKFSKPLPPGDLTIRLKMESVYAGHNLSSFRIGLIKSAFPFVGLASEDSLTNPEVALREFAAGSAEMQAPYQKLQTAKRAISDFESTIPNAMVIAEKPGVKELKAPVHHRGEYLSPGEMVTAGTPTILPQPAPGTKLNRLNYAKWLVSSSNPLTARVQMNRIWAQYFGRGIVATDEDFGLQGSLPTHPRLLDWLATEFMAKKWDMKAMHRLIVTSSTYRQSSASSKRLQERDPENVLFARGPRVRMDAEMIRDNALAASGILNPKVGGPSVMPYQPEGIWGMVYTNENWRVAQNDDRNRRGLYVFIKRTSPYPSFMAFDATPREVCATRRSRTNTPLQALTLLNDRAYLEPASALGVRMATNGVAYGFRSATGRKPSAGELNVLNRALSRFKTKYGSKPELAKALGGNPTTAAYTMLGNVILNLDETITKE
ncbi:MAG: DUF1549 and DUF1553 domain-containing protein [Armatimonadota bacterium]